MAKAKLNELPCGETRVVFRCPGCKCAHSIPIAGAPVLWTWNGDLHKPTFLPSIYYDPDRPESTCHSFVRDGQIQFLGDCFHELAGQTVNLPEWVAAR